METINQPEEIKKYLIDWAQHPQGFLLLSGKNGTGKSFAADRIYEKMGHCKRPYHNPDLALFYTQATLNIKWLDMFKHDGATYLYSTLIQTKLLVLDDIGTRTPTDAFMDFLYAVVDDRYNNRKATIITTNLSSTDMREKFGDAFTSRVASGKCFRLEGKDRRFKEF